MKKLFFSFAIVFALCGCTKNKLIGTWQAYSSDENERLNIAVGGIQTFTYEANGDYHSNVEIQVKMGEKSTSITTEIKGTWEMVDDSHFRVKTTTASISGEEMKNETDETYTILSIDDDILETMHNGSKKNYKRVDN